MRRRLLLVTLATTSLVVIAFAIPLGALVRSVGRDRAIAGAERDIAALSPALALTTDPGLLTAAVERTATGADGRLTVWPPDGSQLGDQTPVDADSFALAREQQVAFSEERGGELVLYAPVVTGTGDVSVLRARLPDDLLRAGVTRAWFALGGVAVVLIAAAGLLADRLARSLTSDATALAHTARQIAGGDGAARVAVGDTPELADAARALNLLADRIDELRVAERERVADLSHRLRTPLTALRLDAEAAGDPELVEDVDRLQAAVTELVRAARRPLHESPVAAHCDLAAVLRERSAFWAALAADDERPWSLDVDDGVTATVDLTAEEAAAAVDALVGNVFAHTADGTAYRLGLQVSDGLVRVEVDDAGPGLPDPEAALRRGVTGAGTSGLGLDIARQAVEGASGALSLGRSPLGGTRVRLELPIAHG